MEKIEKDKEVIKVKKAEIYSAIGELYQTSLGSEFNAIEQCKKYLDAALRENPKCLDGYFQYVHFNLNIGNKGKAEKYMEQLLKIMLKADKMLIEKDESPEVS